MFRAHLAQAEGDMIDAETRRLLQLQDDALTTIEVILQDGEASAGVRLRAAQAVLDYLLKLRELRNLDQRLTALEAVYARDL